MSFPLDLLDQAQRLVKSDARKPKQANLRRGVSAAYYATFHLLSEEAAGLLVGVSFGQSDLRKLTARVLNHAQIKNACADLLKTQPPEIIRVWCQNYGFTQIPEFRRLAESFRELQEERHRADYDLTSNLTRTEAQISVDKARKLFEDWQFVRTNHPEATRFFAQSLFFLDAWRKR